MKPGRELDALVAEKVMGYPAFAPKVLNLLKNHIRADWNANLSCIICGRVDATPECLPHYSTDISAAWEVVVHMVKHQQWETWGLQGYVNRNPPHVHHGIRYWRCDFGGAFQKGWAFVVEIKTAPHAICLAALKAVDSSKED